MVSVITNTKGATKETKKPTLSASIIYESATSKKNILKKYLN